MSRDTGNSCDVSISTYFERGGLEKQRGGPHRSSYGSENTVITLIIIIITFPWLQVQHPQPVGDVRRSTRQQHVPVRGALRHRQGERSPPAHPAPVLARRHLPPRQGAPDVTQPPGLLLAEVPRDGAIQIRRAHVQFELHGEH